MIRSHCRLSSASSVRWNWQQFVLTKTAYYGHCYIVSSQLLHTDKAHQMPLVGGPNMRITNPRWRMGVILEKSKNHHISAAWLFIDSIVVVNNALCFLKNGLKLLKSALSIFTMLKSVWCQVPVDWRVWWLSVTVDYCLSALTTWRTSSLLKTCSICLTNSPGKLAQSAATAEKTS